MRRAVTFAMIVLALLLLFWGALHVMIVQVNPKQEAPDNHFGEPCWACHIVNSAADTIEP